MSNSDNNNKSTDIGKGAIDNTIKAGKKGKSLYRNAKKLGKFAKILKSILSKVIGSCIKWLLGVFGPYVLVVIVLIILLLLVLDSVVSYDLFQEASTRNEAEVVFDNAIKEVFELKLEAGPAEIRDRLRESQPPPYPAVSESWLYQVGDLLKQSIALPTIHHYFRNIQNKNYKAWHDEYSDYTVDDKLLGKYMKIIEKEMAYYFDESPNFKPIFVPGTSPVDEEYIEITTTTICTSTDEEGNTETTSSGPTTTREKVSHEIIDEVQLGYLKVKIPYKIVKDVVESSSSDGDCVTHTTTESNLYIIDDGTPPVVELLPEELVRILVSTGKEGSQTKLVQVQDLEYSIDLGQEIDPRFPKPDIDYEGLKKCYFKNKSIDPCIGEFVLGGALGDYSAVSGGWFPTDFDSIYKAAADHCGIDWFMLAAVHGQETSFSSNPVATDPTKGSMNSKGELVGAVGHFQFMPATWVGWSAAKDFPMTSAGHISGDLTWITVPANIKKYGGYGLDGNGDGVASPWDMSDAAFAAACYLKNLGYQKGNETSIKNALAKYNGGYTAWQGGAAQKYAKEVWNNGKQFESGAASSPIAVAPGDVTYPTTGPIRQQYGGQVFHYGIDIGAAGRTDVPIVSIADGVVSYVGPLSTYGNIVRVKHNINGEDYETLYAHLASYRVKKGETVKKGQQIAIMGNTGRSTGPHLHFEVHKPNFVRQATHPMNPLRLIPTPPLK
ncbi:peptidoglycan DD-metalloendopeptidase family protein [Lysinibacillus xylanilyticus]|uniref:peptidoglycan DD-metalloendopeptidase family protein n=1 Tax=Lysinibacillus xylanilyticus TaxID=582475 RepID=UPI002B240660|nr:peptidoglycan DD-metalloendopeptidase family protein [Lysinibacillus xylanilyticus]MEB2280109.1 peptidoglycan DD-metalloendopeptidase family protein [Lysinibacillus xylanilyticus]